MDTEQLAEELFGDTEVRERFEVTDYKSADWCLVQVKRAADHLAKVDALYEEYKAKLDAWRDKARVEADKTVEQMEYFLRPFAEDELRGQKKRSFELVNGKVGFRKLPDKIDWDPAVEDDIIEWAEKEMPAVVKIKKSISKSKLMENIKNGSELPEAVKLVQGEDRFYIDVT